MINEIKFGDKLFPKRLSDCSSFPSVLYVKGDATLLSKECIAVIGQRDASERYNKIAYKVGSILAREGYVILNGLAIGCDKSALMGALSQGGKVIAVLPCGLDLVYPSSCKEVADTILNRGGCIVSQYPLGTKPVKYRFVERDKIQAKLSSKIMVISSNKTGGTMHTVDFAIREGRNIGCFLETNMESPEGNVYICEKLGSYKVFDTDSLLDFVSQEDNKQLSFFDIC